MADSSPQYFKMCAALPAEFSENHHFVTSDFVLQKCPTNGELYKSVTIVAFTHSIEKVVWIPRLSQLLEIVAEHDGNYQAIFTLQSFKLYTDQQLSARHDWGLKFSTLEQMALCYVMHEIHGLTWTGEKWEKG